MTRFLILLAFLISSLSADTVQGYLNKLRNMDFNQREVYTFISYNAAKENLKYTMLAIALEESVMGEATLNLGDTSCGIFGKKLKYFLKELGKPNNNWNRSRACESLMRSYEYSYIIAIKDFKKWLKVRKGNWREAVMSYNQGYYIKKNGKYTKPALQYYHRIRNAIKAIRIFEKESRVRSER